MLSALTMIHFSVSICTFIRLFTLSFITCFHRVGAVVARVRMNKLDASAYRHAFEAIFNQVKKNHPEFGVCKTLEGIIADWSDTQLQGLQAAIGEERANKVVKGCQV